MEKDPKRSALNRFLMNPEEIEAYSEPSIMDEYIRLNDPEQYENIQRAKLIQSATDLASSGGGAMGMIGRFKPTRVPYIKGKHYQADAQKIFSKQDLNPEKENFGKVIEKLESPGEMSGVKGSIESSPLTLEERVDAATEKEKALFQRLLELTGKKKE